MPMENGLYWIKWWRQMLVWVAAWFDTQSEDFHAEFPEEIKKLNLSINTLELLTVVVTAKVWGE